MDDKAWELLVSNIKEIREDVKEIKRVNHEQNKMIGGIKATVYGFASVFGLLGAYLQKKLFGG